MALRSGAAKVRSVTPNVCAIRAAVPPPRASPTGMPGSTSAAYFRCAGISCYKLTDFL